MKKLFVFLVLSLIAVSCSEDSGEAKSTLNGSYAKLLTVGDYLYAINNEELTTFDISNALNPIEIHKEDVGFDIENIYHNKGVLFIGSQEALHIYVIGEDGVPVRKNQTNYFRNNGITSCDPVIADKNYVYVTLSTREIGNDRCARTINVNELRIYDASNIEDPVLLSVTDMQFPKGLAIDGDYLFVCEGDTGVKVLDINNPKNPIEKASITKFESYDVIAKDGLLMVVCPNEIRQFDYSDIEDIKFLSTIDL